jgi:hypothetical protein
MQFSQGACHDDGDHGVSGDIHHGAAHIEGTVDYYLPVQGESFHIHSARFISSVLKFFS